MHGKFVNVLKGCLGPFFLRLTQVLLLYSNGPVSISTLKSDVVGRIQLQVVEIVQGMHLSLLTLDVNDDLAGFMKTKSNDANARF